MGTTEGRFVFQVSSFRLRFCQQIAKLYTNEAMVFFPGYHTRAQFYVCFVCFAMMYFWIDPGASKGQIQVDVWYAKKATVCFAVVLVCCYLLFVFTFTFKFAFASVFDSREHHFSVDVRSSEYLFSLEKPVSFAQHKLSVRLIRRLLRIQFQNISTTPMSCVNFNDEKMTKGVSQRYLQKSLPGRE